MAVKDSYFGRYHEVNIMYLEIFDDGDIRKNEILRKCEYDLAKNGVVELIDISNPLNPSYYNPVSEEWKNIMSVVGT